jgi:hypothetical protein
MKIDRKHLAQHWIHSQEEDSGKQLVFRTDDFDFPPARGRDGFDLCDDGKASCEAPAPDDRVAAAPGVWHLDAQNHLVIEQPSGPAVYRIQSVAADRLVLERVS